MYGISKMRVREIYSNEEIVQIDLEGISIPVRYENIEKEDELTEYVRSVRFLEDTNDNVIKDIRKIVIEQYLSENKNEIIFPTIDDFMTNLSSFKSYHKTFGWFVEQVKILNQ